MKKKIIALALGVLFAMPYMLRAEEVEIELTAVAQMGVISGDEPLDGPGQSGIEPPSPTDFRATRNGNNLSVTKQNGSIPSAQAIVTNASTGSIVVNQQFTNSLSQQMPASGVYVLRIQTANGALVGQFIVP